VHLLFLVMVKFNNGREMLTCVFHLDDDFNGEFNLFGISKKDMS